MKIKIKYTLRKLNVLTKKLQLIKILKVRLILMNILQKLILNKVKLK